LTRADAQRILTRPQQQIEGSQILVAGSRVVGLRRFCDRGCESGERADIEPYVTRPAGPNVTRNGLEQANSVICVQIAL
jgi:hypothetical protein